MARTRSLASDVSFDLTDLGRGSTVAERTRGRLLIRVAGKAVWSNENGQGVEWSWDNLLEGLAIRWSDLFLEEVYPFRLSPLWPSQLWMEVRRRLGGQDQTSASSSQLQDAVFEFDTSHNIALMIDGIEMPSVRLLRMGRLMVIDASRPEQGVYNVHSIKSLEEISAALIRLCEQIIASFSDLDGPRANYLRELWSKRSHITEQTLARIFGTDASRASKIENVIIELAANDNQNAQSELRVAARMLLDYVPEDVMASILQSLAGLNLRNLASAIDPLAADAVSELVMQVSRPPHEQGYHLARWLRTRGSISDAEKILDIAASLAQFGVDITASDFGPKSASIDALAIWRVGFTPHIMLNERGDHVRDLPARRATLAHELCHILVDRDGALPFVEVLGGAVAELPERRANAFAAEFLCPMSFIDRQIIETPDPDDLVDFLSAKFEVGRQLAANQVKNWFSRMRADHPLYDDLKMPFANRIDRLSVASVRPA